jgi:cysteine sulfinate desulfinase/cysteine desulfurase-like protein
MFTLRCPCRRPLWHFILAVKWPVDGMGLINPSDLRKAITPRTLLVSIMHANNEGGLLYPRSAPINIW